MKHSVTDTSSPSLTIGSSTAYNTRWNFYGCLLYPYSLGDQVREDMVRFFRDVMGVE